MAKILNLILLVAVLINTSSAADVGCQVGDVSSFGKAKFDQRSSLLHIMSWMRPDCEGIVRAVTLWNPSSYPEKHFFLALFKAIRDFPGTFRLINYVQVNVTNPSIVGWQTIQLPTNQGWKPPLRVDGDTMIGYFYENWNQEEPRTVVPYDGHMANPKKYPTYVGKLGLRDVQQIQELGQAIQLDVEVQYRLPAIYAVISMKTDDMKPCGSPPSVNNARVANTTAVGGSAKPGDCATYVCNSGYTMLENKFVACQPDGIWSALPYCAKLPVVPTCQDPPDIKNGFIVAATFEFGDVPETGDTVAYECDDGFKISGNANISCSVGTWAKAPLCIQIITTNETCELITLDPKDHRIIISKKISDNKKASIGDFVDYGCEKGYVLNGRQSKSFCQRSANGTLSWSNASPCIPMVKETCGFALDPDDHMTIVNEKISGDDGGLEGDYVEYGCEKGYAFDGPLSKSYCQRKNGNLTWSDVSACAPTQVPTCGPAPQVRNALIAENKISSLDGKSKPGDVVRYVCDKGFNFDGDKQAATCDRSTLRWTQVSNCLGVVQAPMCVGLPKVENGYIDTVSVTEDQIDGPYAPGVVATVGCEDSYRLKDEKQNLFTCDSTGKWSQANTPQCITKTTCGRAPRIANGYVEYQTFSGADSYPGAIARYHCLRRYHPLHYNLMEVICGADSKWPSVLPVCILKQINPTM